MSCIMVLDCLICNKEFCNVFDESKREEVFSERLRAKERN